MAGQDVRRVFEGAEERHVEPGERLYGAGSDPESVYFVTSGHFVLRSGDNSRVGEKAAGSLIGETAALDRGPRTVTVEAGEPSAVLVLPAELFRRRLQEDASAAYEVAVLIAEVLRGSGRD